MGMPKVDNFLGCFTLETGGLVIGWWNLVWDIITILILTGLVIFGSIYDCEDIKKVFEKNQHQEMSDEFMKTCGVVRGVLIVVFVIIILVTIGFTVIAYLCIRGVNRRDHVLIKPLLVLYGITTVFCFLNILSFNAAYVMSGIVQGLISGYLFVVLYSLYDMLRVEHEQRGVSYSQVLQGKS